MRIFSQGYNTWNDYNCDITADDVMQSADAMIAQGLNKVLYLSFSLPLPLLLPLPLSLSHTCYISLSFLLRSFPILPKDPSHPLSPSPSLSLTHTSHQVGYEYVNIDDCWQISRDAVTGVIIPDPQAFPDGIQVPSLSLSLSLTLSLSPPPQGRPSVSRKRE